MKILGIIIIIWGVSDLGLSWLGVDLYEQIGVQLSEGIFPFTHWIAMAIGYGVYSIGGSRD